VLVEGGARVLASFDAKLSEAAANQLRAMGVEIRSGLRVTAIDETGVSCGAERIAASTVLWAAGVRGSSLCQKIGLPVDRGGRAIVEQDCSIKDHPEVFVIGDAAGFVPEGSEHALPGVSPVAMQQGRFVARQIVRSCEGAPRQRFKYIDKGSMATIGRSRAVAQVGRLQFQGFLAWLAWLALHIFYLIDFRNRIVVLLDWAFAYFSYKRGSRLITGHRLEAGSPIRAMRAPEPQPAPAPPPPA
jgi:NADH dehydrogenase